MSQTLTSFHMFPTLPEELRWSIWEYSAAYPRFLELVVKPNYTTSSTPVEQAFAYFRNATRFNSQLPGGLVACKESRRRILPQYSLLDLGTYRVQRRPDVEYTWEVAVDADPDNLEKTHVLFNPECDIVVLEVGQVLFKQGVLQTKIPRQLRRTHRTRADQNCHVQHLATAFFPWDESNQLPNNSGDMVEAFPGLSHLYVIGQRSQNEGCGCGHCPPPLLDTKSQEEVKNKVIETLKKTLKRKGRDPQKILDIRTYSVNHESSRIYDPQRPWYGFIRPRKVFTDGQGFYLPSP
ncbi:hypothetical protein DL98DRAFT_582415 [Cadophora sp. DSE1049]|nr:hypothetical protein DL98DRAFT_582415 [Cadophora sp. DSE1049]